MNRRVRVGMILGVIMAVVLLGMPGRVQADVGPKPPIMWFQIEYAGEPESIEDATLYECRSEDCSERQVVESLWWMDNDGGIVCEGEPVLCQSYAARMGSGPGEQYLLTLTFADGVRESAPFGRVAHTPEYRVVVEADRLVVTEVLPPEQGTLFYPANFILAGYALLVTLGMEVGAAVLVRQWRQWPVRGIWLVNLISWPIVWFGVPFLNLSVVLLPIVAEVVAIGIEWPLVYALNRKDRLGVWRSGVFVVGANMGSALIGLIGLPVVLLVVALVASVFA